MDFCGHDAGDLESCGLYGENCGPKATTPARVLSPGEVFAPFVLTVQTLINRPDLPRAKASTIAPPWRCWSAAASTAARPSAVPSTTSRRPLGDRRPSAANMDASRTGLRQTGRRFLDGRCRLTDRRLHRPLKRHGQITGSSLSPQPCSRRSLFTTIMTTS